LLPPKVPHSPQRYENTVGLVIERSRTENEKDGLRWYCDECSYLLYEESFKLVNIETDFPPVFDRFFNNINHRTCQRCSYVMPLENS
jgi:3-hydroxyanthranilate 3,4-dioxygenase